MPLDSKHSEASFSSNSTDLLCLWVANVPRCQDLVIFLLTKTTTTTEPITLPLVHARGVITCKWAPNTQGQRIISLARPLHKNRKVCCHLYTVAIPVEHTDCCLLHHRLQIVCVHAARARTSIEWLRVTSSSTETNGKIHSNMASKTCSTNVCHAWAIVTALQEFQYKWMHLYLVYTIAMLVCENCENSPTEQVI